MSTSTIDLKRSYNKEERDALFNSYIDALKRNDIKQANHILEQMPIHPVWAKAIFDVFGRQELIENYNITEADRVYGEDWMNG